MNAGNAIVWIGFGLGIMLLSSLVWGGLLRRQVQRRTRQLQEAISRHEETERALESSERYLRSLVETLPQNILRKDLEGRFTFVNELFCRSVGKPMQEILGKTDYDLFPRELADKFRRDDQQVLASGKLFETVEENRTPTGDKVYVQVFKNPLYDSGHHLIGLQVIFWDVTARKAAEDKLETTHKRLVEVSRLAGMTEVATSVLHNVGNVLNSVNISVSLVSDHLKKSMLPNLSLAATMLREHEKDLGTFFTTDPKGQKLPIYLEQLAERLNLEHSELATEVESLRKNIDHIKDIVDMQQDYARVAGIAEPVQVTELIEDAIRMHIGALSRHEVQVSRDYAADLPVLTIDKHKVLQILVNLIHNAKYACAESDHTDRQVTVRAIRDNGCLKVSVCDNGIGIPPENITRIFRLGFTTRKNGHGYGLHSCALAAKELGGRLLAKSDGQGKGATFTLELPATPKAG